MHIIFYGNKIVTFQWDCVLHQYTILGDDFVKKNAYWLEMKSYTHEIVSQVGIQNLPFSYCCESFVLCVP